MKILLGICICLVFSAVRAWDIADVTGDTSWLVRSSGAASGKALIHTCREAGAAQPFQVEHKDGALVIKDAQGKCFAALNRYGVAVLFSEGDPNTDAEPAQPLAGSQVITALATAGKTAEQALAEVKKIFAAGRISGGQILFIADAKRAFVVECSPRHFAAQELTRAFCVYANSWKLPGMDEASTAVSIRAYTVYQKEWAASELLRRFRTAHNGITVADSIAVSRFDKNDLNADEFTKARDPRDGKSKIEISVHNDKSAGGFILEVDGEFPEFLSCVYMAQGAPRRAVYLPIPLGAATIPQFAAPAATSFGPRDPRIVDFEANLLKEFAAAREEARKLLRSGQRDEAAKLLKDNLVRQAAQAGEFLRTAK